MAKSSLRGPAAEPELVRDWKLLAACTIGMGVGVHALPFYTAGLFIAPLQQSFGWSRAQLSLGPTLLIACVALSAPFAGGLADRFGERRIIAPGLLLLAIFFFGLSRLGPHLGAYYLTVAAMAIICSGSATPTYLRLLNRTFQAARGAAFGISTLGPGVVSLVAPPVLGGLIAAAGWRAGYVALGALVLACAPVIWVMTGRRGELAPPAAGPSPVGFGGALARPLFWVLALAFWLAAFASAGLLVHFVPLLQDRGVARAEAALTASIIGIVLLFARLGAGVLMDRVFAPRVGAVAFLLSAGCFAYLAVGGPGSAVLGAIGIGLAFGSEADVVAYLAGRYFGAASFGKVYGVFYAVFLAGTALSPVFYGVLVDRTGSYGGALVLAAVALSLSALILAMAPAFPVAAPTDN